MVFGEYHKIEPRILRQRAVVGCRAGTNSAQGGRVGYLRMEPCIVVRINRADSAVIAARHGCTIESTAAKM